MPYVNADVAWDEFDTSELVDELARRFPKKGRLGIRPEEASKIKESFKGFFGELGLAELNLSVKTLDDQIKKEAVSNAWPRLTAAEFENRLK
jgi:hypothetical protein